MKDPLISNLNCWHKVVILQCICLTVSGYGIKFIVEPQDTIVPAGGSGILNCAARGIPPTNLPRISWKKDGSLISFVGDTRRSILANGSLHITSLFRTREARPDEGVYQCFVTLDGVGSILSRSAKLQTSSLARFDEEPEDITVGLGQTARFSCSAQGIPPPTVVWFKDGHQLTLDLTRMTILRSGSLELSHVQLLDEGAYRCNISNGDKFAMSREGRLTLNRSPVRDTAPVFTTVPKSQSVMASQSVVLECSAVGYPVPTLSWIKNGKTIDLETLGNRYALVGEGNLAISNVEESDKGTIVCRAENHEDSTDASATLDVQVPPRVLTTPGNFYAYEKEDVELPCKIYGKPAPVIQWYKNGDMIMEGDYFQIINGNNLKILGCLSSDTAMYQCFGTNPSGNVQASMHLRVLKKGEEIPEEIHLDDLDSSFPGEILPPAISVGNVTVVPSAPRDLVALLVSTRFVTLSWKAPAHLSSTGKLIGYSVYYKELGSDRERVVNTTEAEVEEVNIQGLQPNKRYTFRVVPFDDKVVGQSSSEITVLTQPEVDVPGQPRFLKAWPVSPTRVDLRWAPPEVTNGRIERYKIFYAEASDHAYDGSDLEKFSTEDLETLDELDEEEDYLIPKNGVIQSLTVTIPEASLEDLRIFTEYFIWVVAINPNGPGTNSDQVRVTTLSDAPTDTPHNVSAEPASSTSIVIHWDPPPLEFRNGIITGYKLKYKQRGRKRAETLTTDGNSRSLALNDLDRGVEHQIKIAALNVNGTGPFTEWVSATTFPRDLDESQVPEKPNSLTAQANADSITITWSPPLNSNQMIRGYTIGWGKGIPDVYSKVVDGKKRSYTIEKLQPNFEYVISLRASNQVGDGIPIYENVRTRESALDESDDGHHPRFRGPQLATPTGLRAIIISSSSAVLSWTDTSLSKGQVVTDRRHYTVRYAPTDILGLSRTKPAYKYINSTALNLIINNLKGNTMYEFSVKVSKSWFSSEWSLVVLNKTLAASTAAPPLPDSSSAMPTTPSGPGSHTSAQDLTLLAVTGTDETSTVILNWQPPKLSRSEDLRGYIIFYTTNPQKEWVQEAVPDDALTYQVSNLTPDTKYFFRMVTRLNKSVSPYTETKTVVTPTTASAKGNLGIVPGGNGKISTDPAAKTNQIILYILIALSVTFALGSVFLCVYYRKKGLESSPKHGSLKKAKKQQELKPPDLWIHHDQMELKGIDKGRNSRATPLSPSNGSFEFGDLEEKVPLQHSTNSLERGATYMSSYADKRGNQAQNLQSLPGIDAGTKTYDSFQSGSSTASSQNINAVGQYASAGSDYATQSGGSSLGTLGRRTNSGLRSFTVPTPPTTHQPPNIVSIPANSKVIRPTTASGPHHLASTSGSPVRRISASQFPMSPPGGYNHLGGSMSPGMSPTSGGTSASGGPASPLHKSYSTEDLSQEISNLEGLMKDLNAITASEFQC